MKKSLVCMIVVFCFILQLLSMAFPAFAMSSDLPNFSIKIYCEDFDIDLSGIEIDVYSAKNSQSETKFGYGEYVETYEFTAITDKFGVVSFNKPSDYFSITIKTNTLPKNYGIDAHTKFFFKGETSYVGNISKIEKVSINYERGCYIPILHNKNNEIIYAETEINTNVAWNIASTVDVCKDNSITYINTIEISVYGEKHIFHQDNTFSFSNSIEKYDYLYNIGLISENDYIEHILLNIDELHKANHNNINSSKIYWKLKNFYNKINLLNDVPKTEEIKAAIATFETYSEEDPNYMEVPSENGHFIVRYNQDIFADGIEEYENIYEIAQTVANEYQAIENYFCVQLEFNRPHPHYISSNYPYYIYIELAMNGDGLTTSNEVGCSMIEINFYAAEILYEIRHHNFPNNGYIGVFAHEYMHAIMVEYGIENDWMHEAFSSWAGIMYDPNFTFYLKDHVFEFLSSPNLSLDYFSEYGDAYLFRHYGSCLFPMYIYQELGGAATIKSILEAYATSNNDPFTAIDTGLRAYNSSLSDAFTGFTEFNYDPTYNYDCAPTNSSYQWNNPNITNTLNDPVSGSDSNTLEYLSCHYYKIENIDECFDVAVTIDLTGCPQGAAGNVNLIGIQEKSDGSYDTISTGSSNDRFTIVQRCIGANGVDALGIVVANANWQNTSYVFYSYNESRSDPTVLLTFDAQGGVCPVSQMTLGYCDMETYYTFPVPTRNGYTFVGWYDHPSVDGVIVTPDAAVTAAHDRTLYAHWAKTYKITNVGADKCLNIYGSNITDLQNGMNVTLWSDSGSDEQKWLIVETDGQRFIRSSVNQAYGLNIYRAGDPFNCNIHLIYGNESDALVDFIEVGNSFKIKLHNFDLYLTVGGSTNGTNVYWAPESNSNYQLWDLTDVN